MHTRGVSKRMAKDQETEEDRREEEAEIITDVYKRQIKNSTVGGGIGEFESDRTGPTFNYYKFISNYSECGHASVSYTHLDVYKRQIFFSNPSLYILSKM